MTNPIRDTAPPGKLAVWAGQVRAPFLILSVVLVLVGAGAAHQAGLLHGGRFLLTALGVVLAHVAVNLFNELSDYRTGIDEHTERTPFSGGSGRLQARLTTPGAVWAAAAGSLAAAFLIGVYLTWVSGWPLLLFILAGGAASVFYTSHMARWALGELAAGVCLGTFVVLGTYYVQTATLTAAVIWASIPPGILTALLLLLNEFPDVEADLAGGRRHLVIVLGRERAAVVYSVGLVLTYVMLLLGVVLGVLPAAALISLLTIPLAVRAALGAHRHGTDPARLTPAMGANVAVVLGTDLLLAVAFFLS